MARDVLATTWRVLTLRFDAEDARSLGSAHLMFGLLCTWIVGVGRYWDNPRAETLQLLGVGSLVYVFVLATFLWLLLWPLRPAHWSFRRLLTFITLTAPPALLYAVPVERFLSLEEARIANVWFLAVVALWRVAMYASYLWRVAELRRLRLAVAVLMPLTLIVAALTVLNLEQAVFDVMAGIRETEGTSSDTAYAVLFLLTYLSLGLFPFLLIAYLALAGLELGEWWSEKRG